MTEMTITHRPPGREPRTVTLDAAAARRLGEVAKRMAPAGSRQPATEPEPFLEAPEVADVATQVMNRWPESFSHLRQHRLAYRFDTKPLKTHGGCVTLARAHVVNPLYQSVTDGLAGIVVVNLSWWEAADDNARMALVDHELSHYATNDDTEALESVKHDLELFVHEASRYGAWRSGIRRVADQLQMFDDSTARP